MIRPTFQIHLFFFRLLFEMLSYSNKAAYQFHDGYGRLTKQSLGNLDPHFQSFLSKPHFNIRLSKLPSLRKQFRESGRKVSQIR